MPLFKMWVGVHERDEEEEEEEKRVNVVGTHTQASIYAQFFIENDPIIRQTMALTLDDDDRQECVLYIHLCISICVHTSSTAVYCQLSSFCNDSVYIWREYIYISDDRCICVDIKANKCERRERNLDGDMTSIRFIISSRWIHLFHDKNNKRRKIAFFCVSLSLSLPLARFSSLSRFSLVHMCRQIY